MAEANQAGSGEAAFAAAGLQIGGQSRIESENWMAEVFQAGQVKAAGRAGRFEDPVAGHYVKPRPAFGLGGENLAGKTAPLRPDGHLKGFPKQVMVLARQKAGAKANEDDDAEPQRGQDEVPVDRLPGQPAQRSGWAGKRFRRQAAQGKQVQFGQNVRAAVEPEPRLQDSNARSGRPWASDVASFDAWSGAVQEGVLVLVEEGQADAREMLKRGVRVLRYPARGRFEKASAVRMGVVECLPRGAEDSVEPPLERRFHGSSERPRDSHHGTHEEKLPRDLVAASGEKSQPSSRVRLPPKMARASSTETPRS